MRLEPLGLDRRHNRYWRLPGAEPAQQQQGVKEEGQEGEVHAAAPSGDRLLFESHVDGTLSLLCSSEALAALMAALERRGARESGLYASLIRHRDQLEAGLPAGEGGWWAAG